MEEIDYLKAVPVEITGKGRVGSALRKWQVYIYRHKATGKTVDSIMDGVFTYDDANRRAEEFNNKGK